MDTSPDRSFHEARVAAEGLWETDAVGVVHDLRLPLGVIAGYADLLQDGGLGALPEAAGKAVDAIVAKASEMQTLLNGLLDAAREDGAAATARQTRGLDLAAEAQAALERALPRARFAGHTLAVVCEGGAFPVRSDPRLLRRILDNLINNAMSHGRPGGRVHITLAVSRHRGEGVIRVADDGDGLSPEARRSLFSPQTDQVAASHGAGLGLAVCCALAARLGARLEVDDSVTTGAAFVLTLPLAG